MKKFLSAFILVLSPFIFFYSAQNTSAAANTGSNQTVVLAKDQVINSDYVVSGNNVDIAGTVNGDVLVAGGNITVEGTVNGDLLAAGGNINIKGSVTGNVRVIGGNIIVTGAIGRNLSSLGGSVSITDSAKIGGSITGAGGTLALYGPVTKDIRIAGGQIIFGNTIGGNVFAYGGQISISPNTNIAGNVTYWSDRKIEIAQGGTIGGRIFQNALPKNNISSRIRSTRLAPTIAAFVAVGKFTSFLASFIVGLLFIIFFPLYSQKVVAATTKGFWTNVGIGLLALIVAPIVIILLLITLIGIPLAIFGGMLFGFILYASSIIASIVIGKWAIKYISKKDHLIWSLFVGLIIFKLLEIVPILGWVFAAIFVMASLGTILIERKYNYSELRAKKLI